MRTLIAVAALSALAACGQQTTTTPEAPTVETPAPAPAPMPVMLTEAEARSRLETEGYTNITGLTQQADGAWAATGTRNGQTTQVIVSETGVSVATTPAPAPTTPTP